MIKKLAEKSARWLLSVLVASLAGLAHAGEFDGHWQLWDTKGQPFEVTLSAGGKADGTHNDAMKHGTWSQEGDAAVIHWDTGWTTRIARQGQSYVKTAYKPGTTPADPPTNHSEAKRIDQPTVDHGR